MENTEKYKEELLKVIKTEKIKFFDHCFGYTTFSRSTAYEHNLDKSDTIRDAINTNKVTAKNKMLNKWEQSSQPTLQIAAFRLMADETEHKKLNQTYVDHTTKGEQITEIKRVIVEPKTDASRD